MDTHERPAGSHLVIATWGSRTAAFWMASAQRLPSAKDLMAYMAHPTPVSTHHWAPGQDPGGPIPQPWDMAEGMLRRGMLLEDLADNPLLHLWQCTVLTVLCPQRLFSVQLDGIMTRAEVERLSELLVGEQAGEVAASRWEPLSQEGCLRHLFAETVTDWLEDRIPAHTVLSRLLDGPPAVGLTGGAGPRALPELVNNHALLWAAPGGPRGGVVRIRAKRADLAAWALLNLPAGYSFDISDDAGGHAGGPGLALEHIEAATAGGLTVEEILDSPWRASPCSLYFAVTYAGLSGRPSADATTEIYSCSGPGLDGSRLQFVCEMVTDTPGVLGCSWWEGPPSRSAAESRALLRAAEDGHPSDALTYLQDRGALPKAKDST